MENRQHGNDPENDSSLLQKFGRKHGFLTPENYFENLPAAIAGKLHSESHARVRNVWFPAKVLAVAAVLAIAAVAGNFYFYTNSSRQAVTPAVMSYEDLLNSGFVAEIDEGMLAEEFQNSEPEVPVAPENLELHKLYQEYLIENNTDISLIINEL